MARQSKYTPQTVKRLTDALKMGSTYKLACLYAGISEDTLANWKRTKSGFLGQLQEAEGQAAQALLAIIQRAGRAGDWRAAAWILERRHPQDFGRNQTTDIEQQVREAAIAEGLDPDAAVREATQILRGQR